MEKEPEFIKNVPFGLKSHPRTLNRQVRVNQIDSIARENNKLFSRLLKSQPHYKADKF